MPSRVLGPRKKRQRGDIIPSLEPSRVCPWLPRSPELPAWVRLEKHMLLFSMGAGNKAPAWRGLPRGGCQENKPTPAWFLPPVPEAELPRRKGHSSRRGIPGTLAWLLSWGGNYHPYPGKTGSRGCDSGGKTQSPVLTQRVGRRRAGQCDTVVSQMGAAGQLEELGSLRPRVALLATPSPSRSLACLPPFRLLAMTEHGPWWGK